MKAQQPTPNNLITFFTLTLLLALPVYVLIGLAYRGVILSPEIAISFAMLLPFAPLASGLILTSRRGGWALTQEN